MKHQNNGFTLVELAVVTVILASIGFVASFYLGWWPGQQGPRLYSKALIQIIERGQNHARLHEQDVRVCFGLSDGCIAEGLLVRVPSNQENSANSEPSAQSWQLLEALPAGDNLHIETNFPDQSLLITADGQRVQQPGTIYVCARKSQNQDYRIVVARSGRVRSAVMSQSAAQANCAL